MGAKIGSHFSFVSPTSPVKSLPANIIVVREMMPFVSTHMDPQDTEPLWASTERTGLLSKRTKRQRRLPITRRDQVSIGILSNLHLSLLPPALSELSRIITYEGQDVLQGAVRYFNRVGVLAVLQRMS